MPALLALFDVPVEDRRWEVLDPPARRQRTIDALRRLLLRESQVQPLLVVFEDLHWIDAETQAVLDRLVESLPTARLLLLVNYRPEYRHGWGGKTYYRQLRLDPLGPENSAVLLEILLGGDAEHRSLETPPPRADRGEPPLPRRERAESCGAGVLAGERGAYRLVKAAETIHVPATVQAILAARIDRLPPEEKGLLQALALTTELGMRPLVAHCHLGLGKLYRRIGDHARAEGAPDGRERHVPGDGHGVLAGEGGGGLARGLTRRPAPRDESATMPRRADIRSRPGFPSPPVKGAQPSWLRVADSRSRIFRVGNAAISSRSTPTRSPSTPAPSTPGSTTGTCSPGLASRS